MKHFSAAIYTPSLCIVPSQDRDNVTPPPPMPSAMEVTKQLEYWAGGKISCLFSTYMAGTMLNLHYLHFRD